MAFRHGHEREKGKRRKRRTKGNRLTDSLVMSCTVQSRLAVAPRYTREDVFVAAKCGFFTTFSSRPCVWWAWSYCPSDTTTKRAVFMEICMGTPKGDGLPADAHRDAGRREDRNRVGSVSPRETPGGGGRAGAERRVTSWYRSQIQK